MSQTIQLVLDDHLQQLVEQTIAKQVHDYLAQRPQPVPQFTCEATAQILSVSTDTVRAYLKLPQGHPRRLKYCRTSDSSHGYRIVLTEIQAWQQRNDIDALNQAAQDEFDKKVAEIGRRRRARRRG